MSNFVSSYQQAALNQQKLQQAMRDAQAAKLRGQVMSGMYGSMPGGQPMPGAQQQAQTPPMPGQPSQPMQQPRPQQLTWQDIMQRVKQVSPNADPATIASFVDQMSPMMQTQSQNEWKMMGLDLKAQQLAEAERNHMAMEQYRTQSEADRRESQKELADIRQQMVDVQKQRADTSEKAREDRVKKLPQFQQKQYNAIQNSEQIVDQLQNILTQYPQAAGVLGRSERARADYLAQLSSKGLPEVQEAAVQAAELSDELQAGLPTIMRYSSYGGGKGGFPGVDFKNWANSPQALKVGLSSLKQSLANRRGNFERISGIGGGTPQAQGPATDTQSGWSIEEIK